MFIYIPFCRTGRWMQRSWRSAAHLFFRLPFSEQVHPGPVHELQTAHLHLQPLTAVYRNWAPYW
jgi:hypothetical protein